MQVDYKFNYYVATLWRACQERNNKIAWPNYSTGQNLSHLGLQLIRWDVSLVDDSVPGHKHGTFHLFGVLPRLWAAAASGRSTRSTTWSGKQFWIQFRFLIFHAFEFGITPLICSFHPANTKHFLKCRNNIFDVGPTLYKCYTSVLCLLRDSLTSKN